MTEQGPERGSDPGSGESPARTAAARVQPVGFATVATGGLEFAVAILLGVFAGQWLDRRIGTGPWFVILGVVVGAAAGFYNLYRTLTTAQPRAASRASSNGRTARRTQGKTDGGTGGGE